MSWQRCSGRIPESGWRPVLTAKASFVDSVAVPFRSRPSWRARAVPFPRELGAVLFLLENDGCGQNGFNAFARVGILRRLLSGIRSQWRLCGSWGLHVGNCSGFLGTNSNSSRLESVHKFAIRANLLIVVTGNRLVRTSFGQVNLELRPPAFSACPQPVASPGSCTIAEFVIPPVI